MNLPNQSKHHPSLQAHRFIKSRKAIFHVFVSLMAFLPCLTSSEVKADLLALQRQSPEIFRFNETSRALVGTAVSPDASESFNGMTVGPDGNLYVADNILGDGRVLRFDGQTGEFMDLFIDYQPDHILFSPSAMTFGPDGRLYIGSGTTNGNEAQILCYHGQTGAFLGAFVPPGSGGLGSVGDMAFGPDGDLYVVDGSQGVLRYSGVDGHFLSLFVSFPANIYPRNLAFGASGDLFVSTTTNSIVRFNGSSGASLGTFITPGAGGLTNPAGLAFGPDGSLYVSSTGSHSVLRYNGTTGVFSDAFQLPVNSPHSYGPTFLAVTPSFPRLKMRKSASNTILNWQGSGTNFILQTTTDLSSPNSWVTVTNSPARIGNENTVAVGDIATARFYRLKRQ
jgi:hypothetical protein